MYTTKCIIQFIGLIRRITINKAKQINFSQQLADFSSIVIFQIIWSRLIFDSASFINNAQSFSNWLKVATSSRSGYFGMPCGAKKNLGRVEKFEKTRFFQYFYWRILEIYWNLKFWKKLSHKNAIKMIWGSFFLLPSRKISQTVAPLIKIVALIWQDFGATFWRFLTQKVAPSDSKHLASLHARTRRAGFRAETNENIIGHL